MHFFRGVGWWLINGTKMTSRRRLVSKISIKFEPPQGKKNKQLSFFRSVGGFLLPHGGVLVGRQQTVAGLHAGHGQWPLGTRLT